MSRMNRFAAAAFAIAGVLSLGSVVGLAQTSTATQSDQTEGDPGYGPMMGGWRGPQGMMGYGGMGPGMMGEGGFGPAMCAMMASHVDGRLAYLKAELKITEAQDSLWKDYAAAVRDNANGMLDHCKTMMGSAGKAALSLPERMAWHEQFMSARLDGLRATNKALKPLYDALSDDQKKTADQMFWGPMGMM